MRSRLGRPSPALVISIVALFVAMGGTSYAAITITGKNVKNSSLTGSDIKNSSLTGSDVKDKSLTPKDFSGSVTGPRGATGATGATGAKGDTGSAGADGTARAYGWVNTATPSFNTGNVKGFTAVTRPSTGIYCLTPPAGIDPRTNPAIATVDFGGSGDPTGLAEVRNSGFDCPTGTTEVRTSNASNTLENSVSFTAIIP